MSLDYKLKYRNSLKFINRLSWIIFLVSVISFILEFLQVIRGLEFSWWDSIIFGFLCFISAKGVQGSMIKLFKESRR